VNSFSGGGTQGGFKTGEKFAFLKPDMRGKQFAEGLKCRHIAVSDADKECAQAGVFIKEAENQFRGDGRQRAGKFAFLGGKVCEQIGGVPGLDARQQCRPCRSVAGTGTCVLGKDQRSMVLTRELDEGRRAFHQ